MDVADADRESVSMAAKAAGIYCVVVPSSSWPPLRPADLVLPLLAEVPVVEVAHQSGR